MHLHSPNLNYNNIMDIDLQIYCCKFYDKNIEVKHTYFLTIPGQKDKTLDKSTVVSSHCH